MRTWLLFLCLLFSCASATGNPVSITTERGFHIVRVDPSFYPKNTKKVKLIFNGFVWSRYKVGRTIRLIRISGLPNTVVLIPLDQNGNHLEPSVSFIL